MGASPNSSVSAPALVPHPSGAPAPPASLRCASAHPSEACSAHPWRRGAGMAASDGGKDAHGWRRRGTSVCILDPAAADEEILDLAFFWMKHYISGKGIIE